MNSLELEMALSAPMAESSNQGIIVIGDSPGIVQGDHDHMPSGDYLDLIPEDLMPGTSHLVPRLTASAASAATPGQTLVTNRDLPSSPLTLPMPILSLLNPYLTPPTPSESAGNQVNIENPAHAAFPFLKLPPEIRNIIYTLVFVSPSYIGSAGTLTKSFWKHARQYRNLALLLSCRQIHKESSTIYLTRNGFEFYYIRPMLEFLEAIGIQGRRLLRKVRYVYLRGRPFVALRYLRSCQNLRKLDLWARVFSPAEKKAGSWWYYKMKDARSYFFQQRCGEFKFGKVRGHGKAAKGLQDVPVEKASMVKQGLVDEVTRVRREMLGRYVRKDLSSVFVSGHYAWKYKDKKEKDFD